MTETITEPAGFQSVSEAEVDSRGRVSIARAGAEPGTRYRISRRADGEILLTPVVSVPRREMLVWENPDLAQTILAGIAEARCGGTADLGDFTSYAADAAEESAE